MDYNAAYKYVFSRLEEELPETLLYHCPGHTRKVIEDTILLAKNENLTEEQFTRLKTAALFHDTGFLYCYKANEPLGAIFAAESLPAFGYSESDIEAIREMILATSIPQRPPFHEAEILCDADLAYIGQGNYFDIANSLRDELSFQGVKFTERQWIRFQLSFLEKHTYFTKLAKSLYEEEKLKVIEELHDRLRQVC